MTILKHIEQRIDREADETQPTATHLCYRQAARFGYELAQEEVRELVEAANVALRNQELDHKCYCCVQNDNYFRVLEAALRKYEEARK